MWKLLEALLTGLVVDPFLILMGAVGSFLILLTVGSAAGLAFGAFRRTKSSPMARWLVSPWLIGAVVVAGMMIIGSILSPRALVGVSSWAACLSGGVGAFVGSWVTLSAAGETTPTVAKGNPFQEGDANPFGLQGEGEDAEPFTPGGNR